MPPRKRSADGQALQEAAAVTSKPAKRARAAMAAVDKATQAESTAEQQVAVLRKEIDQLAKTVAAAARTAKTEAIQTARKAEATAKLYPLSSLLAVGAVAAALAFAISGLRSQPPMTRYQRAREDLEDLVASLRNRF